MLHIKYKYYIQHFYTYKKQHFSVIIWDFKEISNDKVINQLRMDQFWKIKAQKICKSLEFQGKWLEMLIFE